MTVEATEDGRMPNLTPIIHADAFIRYQKELKNLSLQEQRLSRQFRRVWDELQALQAERRILEASMKPTVTVPELDSITEPAPQVGFVFASAPPSSSASTSQPPATDSTDRIAA